MGLALSSLFKGGLKASREDSTGPEFLKEGLMSFMNLGSKGGAGGGSKEDGKGGGAGKEAGGSGIKGLSAVGVGGRHPSGWEQERVSTSGGGGGNTGEGGRGEPPGPSATGGGGGRRGDLSAGPEAGTGGRGGARGGKAGAASSFLTVPPPSVDVLEDRDVDEEDMDTEEIREDFLSGTLGLAFPFPLAGDTDFKNTGTGVSAVGVFDWLEYPLDGEVTLWDFSGDVTFGLAQPLGTWGIVALDASWRWRTGPFPVGAPPLAEQCPAGFPGSSCTPV